MVGYVYMHMQITREFANTYEWLLCQWEFNEKHMHAGPQQISTYIMTQLKVIQNIIVLSFVFVF